MSNDPEADIFAMYRAFNARDVPGVLAFLSPDVDWPNGWEGDPLSGHQAAADYWRRQWAEVDPIVTPIRITAEGDDLLVVTVHQVILDLDGRLLGDAQLKHVYRRHDGLFDRMEIEDDESAAG